MEVNSSGVYSQDSIAAEMLNRLQSGGAVMGVGFSTVSAEGLALHQQQHHHPTTHVVGGGHPALLAHAGTSAGSSSADIILNSDLTQLLVAAQAGEGVGSSSALVPGLAVSCGPSSSASSLNNQGLLSAVPATLGPEMVAVRGVDPTPSPAPTPGPAPGENMTITVHCSMSETCVIVVGQHNWQCCMCREVCGFDASVDQHLSTKHNVCLVSGAESKAGLKDWRCSALLPSVEEERYHHHHRSSSSGGVDEEETRKPSVGSFGSDAASTRSGLEREVALLMAQTFTHSPGTTLDTQTTARQCDNDIDLSTTNRQSQQTHSSSSTTSSTNAPNRNAPSAHKDPGRFSVNDAGGDNDVDENGSTNVYQHMIGKLERAILTTSDPMAKNDLLLVSTELYRMQRELTSKRRQMKRKNHRYIPCPQCGKEVRNRKDLIKQHNRCHDARKSHRCPVCNKMFKYMHTLRRHMAQKGHQGEPGAGISGASPDPSTSSVGLDNSTVVSNSDTTTATTADQASFDTLDVDETSKESDSHPDMEILSSSQATPTASSAPPRALDPPDSSSSSSSKEKDCALQYDPGKPAYEKILAALKVKGEQHRTPTGSKQSLLQCFVCDREIRNRNYYINRHARCHLEDLCYTCSVCRTEFYRTDHYKQHMLEHSNTSQRQHEREKANQLSTSTSRAVSTKRLNLNRRPKTVACKICNKQIFNRAYNIKRHARQHSIMEWESILSGGHSSSSSSTTKRDNPNTVRPTIREVTRQSFLHCGVCGLSFLSYSRKRQHMLRHRTSFSCQSCGERFRTSAGLITHQGHSCGKSGSGSGGGGGGRMSLLDTSGAEQDMSASLAQQEAFSADGALRGPTWKKQVSGQAPSPLKWSCPICQASIIHSSSNVTRHMRELHSEGRPHTCPKCERTYNSYHKMQRHLKSHGDIGGICDVCGKMFQTKASLRSHTKLHGSPEGMFQCPQCPTSFRFQKRLEKHMRKHSDRAQVCPHCHKDYISKVHLQRHISVEHLGIKDYRYKCEQCGAQFFEHIQLRDHIAYRHQKIQIYSCKFCGKGFNCRPTMVRHERKVHTNYLPYKCKHCPQGFPERSKLVAHEMSHTGVSPHKCEVCSKYFTTGGALRAHRNLHLGLKPFACTACGKAYQKNWHLQQHMKKTHHAFKVIVYDLPAPSSDPTSSAQNASQGAAAVAGDNNQPPAAAVARKPSIIRRFAAPRNQSVLGQVNSTQNQPVPGQETAQNQPVLGQSNAQNQAVLGQPNAQNQAVLGQPNAQNQPILGQPNAQNQPVLGQSNAQNQPVLGQPNAQNQPVLGLTAHNQTVLSQTHNAQNQQIPGQHVSQNQPIIRQSTAVAVSSQNQLIVSQPGLVVAQNQPVHGQPSTHMQPMLGQAGLPVAQNQLTLEQPAVSQGQSMLPVVDQMCLQQQQGCPPDTKFVPTAPSVQGKTDTKYIPTASVLETDSKFVPAAAVTVQSQYVQVVSTEVGSAQQQQQLSGPAASKAIEMMAHSLVQSQGI